MITQLGFASQNQYNENTIIYETQKSSQKTHIHIQ